VIANRRGGQVEAAILTAAQGADAAKPTARPRLLQRRFDFVTMVRGRRLMQAHALEGGFYQRPNRRRPAPFRGCKTAMAAPATICGRIRVPPARAACAPPPWQQVRVPDAGDPDTPIYLGGGPVIRKMCATWILPFKPARLLRLPIRRLFAVGGWRTNSASRKFRHRHARITRQVSNADRRDARTLPPWCGP